MQSAARRFELIQDRQSETVSRPVTPTIVPPAEQSMRPTPDEGVHQFVIPWEAGRRPRTSPDDTHEITVGSLVDEPTVTAKIHRLPAPPRPTHRFVVLQKWEGTVSAIAEGEFVAVIRDLTNPLLPEEEATFSMEEVSEADRSLLALGAVFYWSIGYELTLSGNRQRVSLIRLRRLPAWTRREIEDVRRDAETLAHLFGIDDGRSQAAES